MRKDFVLLKSSLQHMHELSSQYWTLMVIRGTYFKSSTDAEAQSLVQVVNNYISSDYSSEVSFLLEKEH